MDSLPEPLRAELIPGGFRVKLPHRVLPTSRLPGLLMLRFGLGTMGVGVGWLAHCLEWEPNEPRLFKLLALGLGCLTVPGIAVSIPRIFDKLSEAAARILPRRDESPSAGGMGYTFLESLPGGDSEGRLSAAAKRECRQQGN